MAATSSGQIDTVMQEKRVFPPPPEFAAKARIRSLDEYQELWDRPPPILPKFWAELAREELHWFEPFTEVLEWNEPFAQWFVGGKTNVSYNCLDRNLAAGLGEPHGHPLGGRAGRLPRAHLCRAAPRGVQVRQRAQEARHRGGRRRVDLHADGARAGHCDAGLRADRRGPLGDLRRLLGRSDRRPQPRRRPSCRSRPTPAGAAAKCCR